MKSRNQLEFIGAILTNAKQLEQTNLETNAVLPV